MSKPYPEEVCEGVERVARNRGPSVTREQGAAGFGVHVMTLSKWMRRADIFDGVKPGTTGQESAEPRNTRRRSKLLEQRNEVPRRSPGFGKLRAMRAQPLGEFAQLHGSQVFLTM
ncbi:hypothetical protein [Streptomyces sp. NPDC058142]|uniref:hypothetical protein n=1 Tax=Streptomyces sp. NPDC058142 TaxID=3346355 RepID=UPI0036E8084D